jgi:EmrB/QacA subfamily drug resistance transporter
MTAFVATPEALDPKRWVTLGIVTMAAAISALDNTVLNVAIPVILRDFHTSLPSVQWVVSGYALTFATLLVIGGRLGDLYGHRRTFVLGATLFGLGSLLASVSTSVGTLVLGEAVIEGVGAALMLPATTAILSTTFHGRERATAFAAWGATVGAGAAFGPVVGGLLTTEYSWRWALRINVVVAPAAVLGALLFLPRDHHRRRGRVDVPGALLVGAAMFLLVFGLSQGSTYGWLAPRGNLIVGGVRLWSPSAPISVIPVAFALAAVAMAAFYVLERALERRRRGPLFEFGQLRHLAYRYGLATSVVMAMAQLALIFVLPIVLEDAKHLSAEETGLWLIPFGLFIILGAQLGAWLTRVLATTSVVRLGIALEAAGLVALAFAITPSVTLLAIMPGYALFGIGYGFASSQLVNVILSDVPSDKAGVASAANSTVRQVGAALGIAVIGALLSVQTVHRATAAIKRSALPSALKVQAISQLRNRGVNFAPPIGTSARHAALLRETLASSVASGARSPLLFAAGAAFAGTFVAFLIPTHGAHNRAERTGATGGDAP